jgi:hypothetical protein
MLRWNFGGGHFADLDIRHLVEEQSPAIKIIQGYRRRHFSSSIVFVQDIPIGAPKKNTAANAAYAAPPLMAECGQPYRPGRF